MLVYPQAIMMAGDGIASEPPANYPVLNANNAIAASCCWLAMPALYEKDSNEGTITLFGGATRTAAGLQVPNNSNSGATWPSPGNLSRINSSGQFSLAWFGTPIAYSADGSFINLPFVSSTFGSFTRWGRSGSTDFVHTRWMNGTTTVLVNGTNTGQGSHLFAGAAEQYVLTFDGSTVRLYRGGALVYSASASPGLANGDTAIRHVTICNRSPDDLRNGIQASDITLAAVFDRGLSQSEVQSLGNNPMQLLQHEEPTNFDYPALNLNNAIAQSILWLADPARFAKDSREAAVSLQGGATRVDGTGVVANGFWGVGGQWPLGDMARLHTQGQYTIWFDGSITGSAEWGDLFQISGPNANSYLVQREASTGNLALTHLSSYNVISGQYQTGSSVMAFTWDGSTSRVYRNGSQVASASLGRGSNSLGTDPIKVLNGMSGTFRRGFIADRALTASEVASVHSNFGQLLQNP
jgi:hypothetical protein